MSSVPPNGGMPPIPPYDPKNQWRVYREQQKATRRAQHEALKAQRRAWKANYQGVYAPRVPSIVGPVLLIVTGVIGLLMVLGRIDAGNVWSWYGQWWPLLLIAAGLAMLTEWILDARRKMPIRRRGGVIGILILVVVLGLCAAGWNYMQPYMNNWNGNSDFFSFLGHSEHDQDMQPISQSISVGAAIEIDNPHGDVNVTAGDGYTLDIQAHEVAYDISDSGATKIFEDEKPTVDFIAGIVQVKSNSSEHGKVNLTVTVPHGSYVKVNAGKGDVTAANLGSGIGIQAHGDVRLDSIAGQVTLHFSGGKHDFSAHQIFGSISAIGDCNDVTLSEVTEGVSFNGQIYGEVHAENLTAPLKLHTSVTDVQLVYLPGDMTMDSNNLRISETKGPVHVITRSKDVDLSQIDGDISVENSNGTIKAMWRLRCRPTLRPRSTATRTTARWSPNSDCRSAATRTKSSPAGSERERRASCSAPATAICTSRRARHIQHLRRRPRFIRKDPSIGRKRPQRKRART
jgi:DUF4097 and DUF4098 domain-containing protein YvlB